MASKRGVEQFLGRAPGAVTFSWDDDGVYITHPNSVQGIPTFIAWADFESFEEAMDEAAFQHETEELAE